MLQTFLPRLSSSLNSVLATQAFCVHFLPLSHPQYYLPAVFKLWEAFNSSIWDEQWLDLMEWLSIKHLDPALSDPDVVEELREMARERGEMVEPEGPRVEDSIPVDDTIRGGSAEWKGLRKDVGIYTELQFAGIMTKCLRVMGVPVGGGTKAGSQGVAATDFAVADQSATGAALTMKRPTEKLGAFAGIIIYSMSVDAPPVGTTPLGPSRVSTPQPGARGLLDVAAAKPKTYLAGSKALDALAKLIQATESFFHPSNYGAWAPQLGRFVERCCWEFHKRQKEEERADCKTPQAWRLTPAIRREFVKLMRTVTLLSMFSRDAVTIANAQSSLKIMGYLEPELIFPAVLERAYPALETLTETHRTTACITALSTISPPMISRSVYPGGAKNLVPLLELCLPGLDVNDPIKTMSTAMFIVQAVTSVVIDDLTRPEVQEAESMEVDLEAPPPEIILDDLGAEGEGEDEGEGEYERKLSRREEDDATRMSTAGFPDWVSSFFRSVMVLFEALPEPGKGNRTGGKMEDQMTQTLIAACDFVCAQLSPPLFELALDIVFRHLSTSVRSNSARMASQLVSCFARANSPKTLAKFFKPCAINITIEIEGGASSTRTTSTNTPIESDTTLHWWIGLLTGAVTVAGTAILPYKAELVELLQFLNANCKSERGYTTSARVLGVVLISLTNVRVQDYRSCNPAEWVSDEWQKRHHLHWGRVYEYKDVEVAWHVPSETEIGFALELLRDIVVPALEVVERLLAEPVATSGGKPSEEFINDFCRNLNIVRSAVASIPGLAWLPPPAEPGQKSSDFGDEVPEFIDQLPHCVAGICLTDPADPRHQFVLGLRERTGRALHAAVASLKNTGAEDSIDAVKMIISAIRVLQLDYPCDHAHYASVKKSLEFAQTISRTTRNQKTFPRFVWCRRAALYHASRLRLNSFYRRRSALDDLLIADLADLSLSVYVQVRRAAQKGIDSCTHYFDGTRTLMYDRLFEALKPGVDHDVMKGALYVLGSKMFQNLSILDWRYGPKYVLTMMQASHQERPSIQQLVKQVIHDFIIRLAEPSTLKATVESDSLRIAADHLEALGSIAQDGELVGRVAAKARARIEQKNEAYDGLLPKLLEIAVDPGTHWRYSLTATRFLRALIRRDQPLRADVATYLANQLISDLPNQRTHSMLALTKILHFVKLRTASGGSAEKLLLNQTTNPLRRKVKLEHPLPADFTESFLASFSKPLDKDTLLCDKASCGWLVWGDYVEFYEVPPPERSAITWDLSSAETIEQVRTILMTQSWWEAFVGHLSQEKTVDYLQADAITLVKSVFQIFEDAALEFVLPLLDPLVTDKDNRHKQRAAGELIGGMVRGSKHWPLTKSAKLWGWLTPRLPGIFEGITPETQVAWEMCAEYILAQRDPRRNQPLVDYLTNLTLDFDSSEAFNTAKRQDLVGTAIKSLGWHFAPWSEKYVALYSANLNHPFSEVRGAVSDSLKGLTELRLHPSYSSVDVFLKECSLGSNERGLMQVDQAYLDLVDSIASRLAAWREVRQPAASGTQDYDKASLTILTWIWTSVSDHRISTAFPFITTLLPEFFRMQEVLDNDELRSMAMRVVIASACLPLPRDMAGGLCRQFIELLRTSPSWRVRLEVLLPLQIFYFHNLFLLADSDVAELMDLLCGLLRDPKIEVREAAATTLSGIVRCSQRSAIVALSTRFMGVLRSVRIPTRRDQAGREVTGYQDALVAVHAAILGLTALVRAFPYEVPAFLPGVIVDGLGRHAASPVPISTAVRACLADFKRSHQDSWTEDQKVFSDEQLMSLNDLLMGSSYYA